MTDFFERRTITTEGSSTKVNWPSNEIVKKIEKLGCHVVPKPSKKKLASFQKGKEIYLYCKKP